MIDRKTKWRIVVGALLVLVLVLIAAGLVAGPMIKKRFEPYIRGQAIAYLSQRFDSDVALTSLRIRIPPMSPVHMLFTGGRGTLARVINLTFFLVTSIYSLLTYNPFTFEQFIKPQVSAALIDRLIAAFDPEKGALSVMPTIDGRRGNPVLWARRFFSDLLAVEGDVGARHLIGGYAEAVAEVPVEDAAALTDVDTPEALIAVRAAMDRV